MTEHVAACFCESLVVRCAGEPIRVSMCHCLDCQRRSGSAFAAQARFPADRVTITGASNAYVRTSDDGNRVSFHFCPTCGGTAYYVNPAEPGIVLVPIGAFADPTFPAPTISNYENRRHPWVTPPEGAEHN